jgi:hypothetical protein
LTRSSTIHIEVLLVVLCIEEITKKPYRDGSGSTRWTSCRRLCCEQIFKKTT